MATDTSEKGLEKLICLALTGTTCEPDQVHEESQSHNHGWVGGWPADYDRDYCVDLFQLTNFLRATQPKLSAAFDLDNDSPARRKFLARLQGEITKRGVIDVLRNGIKDGPFHIDLYYATPTPGNYAAAERHAKNRFSITRQLRYSKVQSQRALDLCLFINGLPIATFELKNNLTKQTVDDAVEQYKRDRDPKEKLFEFGRCAVHFALDEQQVKFCTHLKGKASWFLPFNQGWNDGAGNPPNPDGLKTAYLWEQILSRPSLTNIIENFAQIVEKKDPKTGKKKPPEQLWPRFHQLDVVRKLLSDARAHGVGKRYLIQHSAGSGKSNSIAWLARQLMGVTRDDALVFDSIIVVTDRQILDTQIRDTIKGFTQVKATVGHAEHSDQLRQFIETGKQIIISTVQKFPVIYQTIGSDHRGRHFAIVIDEAHSSQGGRTSAKLNVALSPVIADDEETTEDKINHLIETKKLLPNASYFAFTATPKNKTLELFGDPYPEGGEIKHRPFHSYTMKQAIDEGFILDVLKHYTPVAGYYRLIKNTPDDPEYDTKKAKKKLRRYVEGHDHAIRLKAEIMVDHFHEQVLAPGKIGGQARAMVVTSGIERAIQYYHAISAYLVQRKSPYRAIVAFSGEHEDDGKPVTEAMLNGFPSSKIADKVGEEPYRFLICADKFQTGYDEPLLHTMYVDKQLSGIKAVQTLSRLNRARPQKHDVFVLDFMNDVDTIRAAFADYYRTTILSAETDPNNLHDLKAALDGYQVYAPDQVERFVELYLKGADRPALDPILDICVASYKQDLDEDGQVDFKGKAKGFLRMYGFLAAILGWPEPDWEKLSIFLNFLVPKLPAPVEEDLSKGILEAIDMESYRVEKQAVMTIQLPDQEAEIDPVLAGGGGHKAEPELDRLSHILKSFNELCGHYEFSEGDRVRITRIVTEELTSDVLADAAFKNAKEHSDKQNARIEHDKAVERAAIGKMRTDTAFFKLFMDNESFRRLVMDTVFQITYVGAAAF